MILKSIRLTHPVQPDGEGIETSGKSFSVGSGGVWEIEATPFGVVIRRHAESGPALADLVVVQGGWGIVEKKQKPVMGKQGKK